MAWPCVRVVRNEFVSADRVDARHRRSLLFLLLLPVVAGIGAAFSLPVALFPNIQFPRVRISLDAGDRPAQQMVLQVTTPVEQALLGIPG